MILKEMELKKLKTAAYNPRVRLEPGMEEFEKLKNSIETFGYVEPIVWNERTGNVVGGHQRLAVLQYLKKKKAFVSVVDMDETQEKLLNLALNKAKGEWDEEKLESLLKDVNPECLENTGFGADEIAILLGDGDDLGEDWSTDGENDWNGEDVKLYGASYIVTCRFESIEQAREWVKEEGLEAKLLDGTHSSVIRMLEAG